MENKLELFQSNGITTLDFSNQKHYQFYLNLFNSIELEGKYPLLKAIIENTRAEHIKNGGCDYKTLLQMGSDLSVSDTSPWVDGIIVDYLYRDANTRTIYGQITVSLIQEQSSIITQIQLMEGNKSYTQVLNKTSTDACHQVYTFNYSDINSTIKIEEIDVIVTVSQISNNLLLKAQTLKVQSTFELNENTPVKKIAILDPENIQTRLGDAIIVSYGRQSSSDTPADYYYDTVPNNIQFPFNGFVFLKDNCVFDTHGEINLSLDCGSGFTEYNNTYDDVFKVYDGLGFSWNFPLDWGQPLNENTYLRTAPIVLTFQLDYRYKENNTYQKDTIIVSGILNPDFKSFPSFQQMAQLKFQWGCLGRNTQIKMGDKTEKRISDIIAGDYVYTYSGQIAAVRQVLKGFEKEILSITTESGHAILATPHHPFATRDGLKQAEKLTREDKLLMENGDYELIIEMYYVLYNDDVYNLTLIEEFDKFSVIDACLFADGFVVGNNDHQNQSVAQNKKDKVAIPENLKIELIKLSEEQNKR